MALPKISTPFYETKLPSTGEALKYRPFLVKEEKLLLMAMEGGKQSEISNALRQIINNCTDGAVDVDNLPMFDVEFLFLQLRIKSIEEVAKIQVKCEHCGEATNASIDLKKVKVHFPKKKTDVRIQLNESIGVTMKYPTLGVVKESPEEGDAQALFELISSCIDNIYDEEQIYNDFTKDEVNEFIENLPQEQFKKISDFFENMPKLQHDLNWTCPACGEKNSVRLSGLQDFFESASLTTT